MREGLLEEGRGLPYSCPVALTLATPTAPSARCCCSDKDLVESEDWKISPFDKTFVGYGYYPCMASFLFLLELQTFTLPLLGILLLQDL